MSLKSTILSVTRRTKKGFTVGEIFDRVAARGVDAAYSTVRARVYELEAAGLLWAPTTRKDSTTGRMSLVFRRT